MRRLRFTPFRAVLLAAALAAACVGVWAALRVASRPAPAKPFQTMAVRRGDLVSQVTATGTLSPVVLVEVGSQVSGTIKELGADFNTRVAADQVIARLDPRFLELAVSQARARVASARADLRRTEAVAANARAQHERSKILVQRGIASAADLDTALAERRTDEAQVDVATAQIVQANAALEQAEVNLAYATIRSPIDGIVISRNVDVGQTVAASLQSPTLFVIARDLRQMEVHTSVAESDIGQVREGLRAEFTVDAFPGKPFAGTVKQVRFEAKTVQNVVTYDAVIGVVNETLELRPGMTASVTFAVEERRGVLLVPARALRYRPAAAGEAGAKAQRRPPAVWVLRDGKPVAVRVEVGLSDGTSAQVSGDLREGEPVIVGEGAGAAGAVTPSRAQPRPPRIL